MTGTGIKIRIYPLGAHGSTHYRVQVLISGPRTVFVVRVNEINHDYMGHGMWVFVCQNNNVGPSSSQIPNLHDKNVDVLLSHKNSLIFYHMRNARLGAGSLGEEKIQQREGDPAWFLLAGIIHGLT